MFNLHRVKNDYQNIAGYSVLEMVNAFEKATGQKVPYELSDRRPGDVASAYASTDLAEKELGWKSRLGIEDMCKFMNQNCIWDNMLISILCLR